MKSVKDNSISQNKRTVDPIVWIYVFVILACIVAKIAVIIFETYQRLGVKLQ